MLIRIPPLGEPTEANARLWLLTMWGTIGMGFHPDTPGADYLSGEDDDARLMSPQAARAFDDAMQTALDVLPDPYGLLASPETWTREECIAMLCANDHNGDFTDEATKAQGLPPLTLEDARSLVTSEIGIEFPVDDEDEIATDDTRSYGPNRRPPRQTEDER